MNKLDIQEHLIYITGKEIKSLNSKKILGVTAFWKDETAYITIFFDIEPNEDDLENASCICTEIIANFPVGMLDEHYVFLKNPEELPEQFLAYKRDSN